MIVSPLRLALVLVFAGLLSRVAFDWITDQRDEALRERDNARDELQGMREAARISGEMLAARDQVDLQRTKELKSEQDQNLALRRDVVDGRKRLRLHATCSVPVVPDSARSSSVVDADTAELAGNARPDYFTLRDQLALSKQMILGLQDHIRLTSRRSQHQSNLKMENSP
ncbi:lysis system i-spanin subunit Rz [Pseudomonas huanghezhanensis]|uniref:lysis system i-spanin subunit Rz n=1 Tax=Pseudomonas huanghezhanensis TaxID=3002903 RepID=UPI002286CAA3|nr:lysis system i-spanin subunit Rz [Pseudomonas sp. BSw22131]